jgi:predicted TIM-barrel fold metal-dependent hydrolase
MIVDAHVHASVFGRDFSEKLAEYYTAFTAGEESWITGKPWSRDGWCVPGDQIIEHMDHAGVDRAIIMALAATPVESYDPTMAEYIAELCSSYDGRFIGFYSADPIGGDLEVMRLRAAVKELGLSGLKLMPAYNHVAINDRRIWPLYEEASALGIPVTVHTGWDAYPAGKTLTRDHPLYIEDALVDFPGLRPILAHCGFSFWEDVLFLMAGNRNVAADLSWWAVCMPQWRSAQVLSMAKQLGVFERLFWGTDYPYTGFSTDLEYWRTLPRYAKTLGLEPRVDEEDIDKLLGANVLSFLEVGVAKHENGGGGS